MSSWPNPKPAYQLGPDSPGCVSIVVSDWVVVAASELLIARMVTVSFQWSPVSALCFPVQDQDSCVVCRALMLFVHVLPVMANVIRPYVIWLPCCFCAHHSASGKSQFSFSV